MDVPEQVESSSLQERIITAIVKRPLQERSGKRGRRNTMRKSKVTGRAPTDGLPSIRGLASYLPIAVVSVRSYVIEWHNQAFGHLFDPDSQTDWEGRELDALTGSASDKKTFYDLLMDSHTSRKAMSAIMRCHDTSGRCFLAQFTSWNEYQSGDDNETFLLVQEIPEHSLQQFLSKRAEFVKTMNEEEGSDGTMLIIGSRIIHASDRLHNMLGYPLGSLAGCAHWKIYHTDFHEELRQRVKEGLCSDQNLFVYEMMLQKMDATPISAIGLAKKVVLDGQIGLSVSIRDISDIKPLPSGKLLANRSAGSGEFVTSLAKEFTEALLTITGCARRMYHELNPAQSQLSDLQNILVASEQIRDLIARTIAIPETDQSGLEITRLSSIVDHVTNYLKSALPFDISISRKIETDIDALVLFEESARHQIEFNLPEFVSNISKLGVPLTIRISDLSIHEIQIPGAKSHGLARYVLLEISPSTKNCESLGPTEESGNVDNFRTSIESTRSAPTIREFPGVHGPVAARQFKNSPYFSMTFAIGSFLSNWASCRENARLRGSERILLVDDDVSVVDTITQMLEPLGYRITGAYGSMEALSIFRNAPYSFDMVLTDLVMPEMTGLFLAREMIKIRPGFPIIILTGFVSKISMTEAKSMGISMVLTKPFTLFQLASAVRGALESRIPSI